MSRWVPALAAAGWIVAWSQVGAGDVAATRHWREPAAIVWSADGQRVFTANEKSGSISVIDAARWKVVGEYAVAQRLVALAALPGSTQLLALDDAAHELLVLSPGKDNVEVAARLAVPPYPVKVAVASDGRSAVVSSLWSRTLSQIELPTDGGLPRLAAKLELPFPPRELLLIEDAGRLIVGDAFDGRLGVVELPQFQWRHMREFPAHNIRGLARSADGSKLIVAHQMLNELAQAIQGDVHWGLMMSNDLRWLRLAAVLEPPSPTAENPKEALYRGAHMHPLGEPGRGGGDPSGLAVAKDGTVLVSLGGVNEVAIGKEDDFQMRRLGGKAAYNEEYAEDYEEVKAAKKKAVAPAAPEIGRRPTALAASPDGKWAIVACTFDDLLAVVDVAARKVMRHISLGPTPELTASEAGARLFYDARLSHDGWMSCHSCHTDGHTNNQRNDNLSDNGYGAPKRVLSLLGQRDTAPYAWSGATPTLMAQVRNSTMKTMQGREPSEDQVAALVAFVETLTLPPPVARLQGKEDEQAIGRGEKIFAARNCAQCHAAPTFTTPRAHDAGIQDELEVKFFNPPSLRGLSHRGPYFHDNRAATLEDVFFKHAHPRDATYEAEEVRDLAAYLRSL